MLVDQTNPKGKWPLGRVVETYPGKDSHTRTVKVVSNGKEYLRPITRLCPLISNEDSAVAGGFGHGGENAGASAIIRPPLRSQALDAPP